MTDLRLRILIEISLVRSVFPWLPFVGVREGNSAAFFYNYDPASRTHWIVTPPMPYDPSAESLRRLIRHEMGHLWTDEWGRRNGGADVYPWLDIDGSHPQRHEIAAEVFSRGFGEMPLYPDLEPLSRVTVQRRAFIETSGQLPDRLAEKVELDRRVAAFWGRSDVPQWFREWAANFEMQYGRALRSL